MVIIRRVRECVSDERSHWGSGPAQVLPRWRHNLHCKHRQDGLDVLKVFEIFEWEHHLYCKHKQGNLNISRGFLISCFTQVGVWDTCTGERIKRMKGHISFFNIILFFIVIIFLIYSLKVTPALLTALTAPGEASPLLSLEATTVR